MITQEMDVNKQEAENIDAKAGLHRLQLLLKSTSLTTKSCVERIHQRCAAILEKKKKESQY